eukprot:m.203623 g.203623  ORF g.203623 m.203623 type:complete len:421 (+) comp32857_c0_seq1:356-1618(+)
MTGSIGNRATSKETFMNLLKVFIGPGCLSLPYAFTKGGFLLAPLVLILMTLMVYRNMRLLIGIKEQLKRQHPDRQSSSYGDITRHVLGASAGKLVDYVIVSMQLGICTVYFRFIPTNLHSTMKSIPEDYFLLMIAPFLIGLTWIRHMKQLAVFSTFANFATVVTIVVVLMFAGENIIENGGIAPDLPMQRIATVPVFFGSVIYSFEGCGSVPSIHDSMLEPTEFNNVLRQAGIVVFFCFIFTGMLCYLSYGDITNGSITAELAHRSLNPIVACLNVLIALAVGLTYPMQAYAAVEVLERKLQIRDPVIEDTAEEVTPTSGAVTGRRTKQIIFRTCLVVATAVLAGSVTQLGLIVSFFGSVNGSLIALILPPILDNYARKNAAPRATLVNWITIVFGTLGGTAGAMICIRDVMKGESHSLE